MIKIGNAQAFWGDRAEAAAQLLKQQPDLDYLTLDYLSEVSLSIMAIQKAKDASSGYARDFVEVVKSLIPFWRQGSKVKVITNAGGLDPRACALACAKALKESGGPSLRIGIVSGDDVLPSILKDPKNPLFCNLESGDSIEPLLYKLATANAYLGAKPIVEALSKGVDIVITGRVADPSLTVAPCVAHFGWSWKDYDRLAQATVAGHLIECGTQVTGGIHSHWLELDEVTNIGFPFVEMHPDGCFVITKPAGSSGIVSVETVKEQLLYEIGDPGRYISPDIILSFLSISLANEGRNRVQVTGAKGFPPPSTYKVSTTFRDGFKAEGSLIIFGRDCKAKAQRCGEIVIERVRQAGFVLDRFCIECLGTGDVVPGIWAAQDPLECVLRICVADHRQEALECFSRQMAPLVTAGPPGTTGYTTGRPRLRPVFGYWPCLIDAGAVNPKIEVLED